MTIESLNNRNNTNVMAIVSMTSGIVGWILSIALLCVNFFLLPLLATVTMGVGLVLYICVIPAGCLSPIAWITGIVTGHVSLTQIRGTDQAGEGMAKAGLVMGYIGLGLTILSICVLVVLALTGVSIPVIDEILRELGVY